MSDITVGIVIVPNDLDPLKMRRIIDKYGSTFSSRNEIRVNQVKDRYSVLYFDNVFELLKTNSFADTFIKITKKHFSNQFISIELEYLYTGSPSSDCVTAVFNLHDYLTKSVKTDRMLVYQISDSIISLATHHLYNDDIIDDEEEDEEGEDDVYDDFIGDYYDDDDEEDGDEEDEYEYEKIYTKSHYSSSRVLASSSNSKKQIRRHSIIISSDNDALKKDRGTIKKFLKDFLPGDSKIIKKYRTKVLNRWMSMYVISKKQAKRQTKKHQKNIRNQQLSNRMNRRKKIMNYTNGILGDRHDPFYDPNR